MNIVLLMRDTNAGQFQGSTTGGELSEQGVLVSRQRIDLTAFNEARLQVLATSVTGNGLTFTLVHKDPTETEWSSGSASVTVTSAGAGPTVGDWANLPATATAERDFGIMVEPATSADYVGIAHLVLSVG